MDEANRFYMEWLQRMWDEDWPWEDVNDWLWDHKDDIARVAGLVGLEVGEARSVFVEAYWFGVEG